MRLLSTGNQTQRALKRETNSATWLRSFIFLKTCGGSGFLGPRGFGEGSYQLQSTLHNVQKGGDFPVVIKGPTGHEPVRHIQQSLQPQDRRGWGGGGKSNISMCGAKPETESDRHRLSGCVIFQVCINSLQRCAQRSAHHMTELDNWKKLNFTSFFCAQKYL